MIKHIVLWTFKEASGEIEKQNNISLAEQKIKELKDKISVVRKIETRKNATMYPDAYDLALLCEFDNLADLDFYQKHPEHLALVEWIKTVRDKKAAIDYEV